MEVVKLYIKNLWHINVEEKNLIIFIDNNGRIKTITIPLEDLDNWDVEKE